MESAKIPVPTPHIHHSSRFFNSSSLFKPENDPIKFNKKPVLVTGSHRSGSTWVGRMIALSPSMAYIHEPLNPRHPSATCRARFENWFPYISEANESSYLEDIKECLQFHYHIPEGIKAAKSVADYARIPKDYLRNSANRLLQKRAVMKDPIAVFSAEWLASRFNMDVVVIIRHPAAFVGSLKVANWKHPFSHFLKQPLLIQDHLFKYRFEIEEYSRSETDIVDQGILLWNMINQTILDYRKNHPEWLFVRHENLSRIPIEKFRMIYDYLGLNYTREIQEQIRGFSFSEVNDNRLNSIRRNSIENIFSWKQRLTAAEIKRVRENTGELACQLYTDADW